MPKIDPKDMVLALGNNVLVEMIEEEKQTTAGIAIPEQSKERETCGMGIVVSTGLRKITVKEEDGLGKSIVRRVPLPDELKLLETFNLKPGDTVLLKKYDYVKVQIGNGEKEHRIYDVKSVIGKIIQKNV